MKVQTENLNNDVEHIMK